jgi:Bifunctional DNA primase/polymerase, N-terminal
VAPIVIPVCWPDDRGACGCGRGHSEKEVGKAALTPWTRFLDTPPTPAEVATWARTWPDANEGELLPPIPALEIDCDSLDALGEATARGLPPAPVMKTARGRRYRYQCPGELVGIRITGRGRSKKIDVLSAGYVVIRGRHRLGPVYEKIVERPLEPAPLWALEWLRDAAAGDIVRIDQAPPTRDGVSWTMSPELPDVDLDHLQIHHRIKRVVVEGPDHTYPSRSEALWAVLLALVGAGYDDATIAAVVLTKRYAISEKPRERGRRWLASELARARRRRPVGVV